MYRSFFARDENTQRISPDIEEFHRRIMHAAEPIAGDIELVIVNDGSPDDSLALALQRIEPCLVVIDTSRNFVHHKASGRTAATVARFAGASQPAPPPRCPLAGPP